MKTQFFNSIKSFFILSSVTLCICLTSTIHAQNVGIGTNTPHPSAILDLSSDSLGLLVPSMTIAQRDGIVNPATGLMVFVTDDSAFYCYEGSVWEKVGSGSPVVVDQDGDTKIEVEGSPDEDAVRIELGGTEYFVLDSGRIDVNNTGKSVFIGEGAGENDDLNDNNNVYIGYQAGQASETGFGNVAYGSRALFKNTSGGSNVAYGYEALTTNTTGNSNISIGYQALADNETGSDNVALGHVAGANAEGNGNVFIGSRAGLWETGSNKLYIENSSANPAGALIYGEFNNDLLRLNGNVGISAAPSEKLDVNGKIRMRAGAVDGYVPVGDANGVMTWTDPSVFGGNWTLNAGNVYRSTGLVGIGTDAPIERLHVFGGDIRADRGNSTQSAQSSLTLAGARNQSVAAYANIDMVNFDNDGDSTEYVGARIASHNSTADDAGDMRFYVSNGILTESMRINQNGNIGVNTETPTQKLDVNGKIRMRTGAANGHILVSDASGVMSWTDPATVTTASSSQWTTEVDGDINFSSGRVGIGDEASGALLDLKGAGQVNILRIRDQDGSERMVIEDDNRLFMRDKNATPRFIMSDLGNIGITEAETNTSFNIRGRGGSVVNTFKVENSTNDAQFIISENHTFAHYDENADVTLVQLPNGNIGYDQVDPNVNFNIRGRSGAAAYVNINDPSNNSIFVIQPSGVFLPGLATGGGTSLVINASGQVRRNSSSRRYKTNIRDLQTDYRAILKARPVVYNRHDDMEYDEVGYIAEEMDSIGVAELVIYDNEGRPDAFNYRKTVVFLNEIIKEHDTILQQKDKRILELEEQLEELMEQNAQLNSSQASVESRLERLERMLLESDVKGQ